MYIAKGGVLTGAEAQVLIQRDENSHMEAVQSGQGEYGNMHHQGVAYVGRFNIRLLCALDISASINIYFIVID